MSTTLQFGLAGHQHRDLCYAINVVRNEKLTRQTSFMLSVTLSRTYMPIFYYVGVVLKPVGMILAFFLVLSMQVDQSENSDLFSKLHRSLHCPLN